MTMLMDKINSACPPGTQLDAAGAEKLMTEIRKNDSLLAEEKSTLFLMVYNKTQGK